VKPEQDILYLLEKGKTHEAMSILMSNYKRFVHSTAIRYLKDDDDAKDLTQEVFIKHITPLIIFEVIPRFRLGSMQ